MKSQDPLPPRIVTVLGELKTFCSQKMTTSHQLMATPTIPCRGHPVSLVNFTEPMLSELTAQLMAGRRKPRRSPWRSVPTPSPYKADPFCTFVVEDLGKICLTGAFWGAYHNESIKNPKFGDFPGAHPAQSYKQC